MRARVWVRLNESADSSLGLGLGLGFRRVN